MDNKRDNKERAPMVTSVRSMNIRESELLGSSVHAVDVSLLGYSLASTLVVGELAAENDILTDSDLLAASGECDG